MNTTNWSEEEITKGEKASEQKDHKDGCDALMKLKGLKPNLKNQLMGEIRIIQFWFDNKDEIRVVKFNKSLQG